MPTNLFQQMYRAIKDSMGDDMSGGIKKRGIKMDKEKDSDGDAIQDIKDHTYSWKSFEHKVDRAHNFADFVKENYGKVDWKDVSQNMKQEYLLSKHTSNGGNCNTSSILTYDQQLVSLGHLCDKFYNKDVGFKSDKDIIPKDLVTFRDIMMKPEDFRAAMNELTDKSRAKFALEISNRLGIRVSSIPKLRLGDFDFDKNSVLIFNAKGGKTFDIPGRDLDWIKDECEKRGITDPEERLITIKADSISKGLYRALESAGLVEYKEHKTGVHAIRKAEAQRFYAKRVEFYLREKGEDWQKAEKHARGDTSVMLGHGSQRSMANYVEKYESEDDFHEKTGM
jgi:integrase